MAGFKESREPNESGATGLSSRLAVHGRVGPYDQDAPISQDLAAMIERQILPRLLVAHRCEEPVEHEAEPLMPDAHEIETLSELLISHDLEAVSSRLDRYNAAGLGGNDILVSVFGPSARRLGDLWLADKCSFADVTTGLGALQTMMRRYGSLGMSVPDCRDRSVRLLAVPGEQHTLGILIVEEFFKVAGWRTTGGQPEDEPSLLRELAVERFDAIALSASCDRDKKLLPDLIENVRAASLNPSICVLVGGDVLHDLTHAECEHIGADQIIHEPSSAVDFAEASIAVLPAGATA